MVRCASTSEKERGATRKVKEGREKHAKRQVGAGGSLERVEEERVKRREMKVGVLSRDEEGQR